MRLILVRHGETDWNRQGRAQGATDNPLNAEGQRQAQQIAEALSRERVTAVYSSPLLRARETAAPVAEGHGLVIVSVDALKELDQGELDGLVGAEMRARYPDLLRQWDRDPSQVKLPGGESMQELQDRAWAAVLDISRQNSNGAVVVVGHNLALLAIICRVVGLPLAAFRCMRLSVGAISVVELAEAAATLVSFNDTCHLRACDQQH